MQDHMVDNMESELQVIFHLFQFPREDQHTLDLNRLVGIIHMIQYKKTSIGPTMLGISPEKIILFTIGL